MGPTAWRLFPATFANGRRPTCFRPRLRKSMADALPLDAHMDVHMDVHNRRPCTALPPKSYITCRGVTGNQFRSQPDQGVHASRDEQRARQLQVDNTSRFHFAQVMAPCPDGSGSALATCFRFCLVGGYICER